MKKIRSLLLNDKNIERSAFLWNAFSAMMNSFQTMVLLIVITRTGDTDDASVFVMAYAVGNLMLNIGKYGVRQFQVTDVREKYSYKEYLYARYCSMICMGIMSVSYVLYNIVMNGYTREKSTVVLLICAVKGIEAFEDVFHGRMQQKGRLDVAGKILGCRLCVFILTYGILYLVTKNLLVTTVLSMLLTLVNAVVLNGSVLGRFSDSGGAKRKQVLGILVECFPLCASACLSMYVANAPKYIIDSVVSNQVQTCFNIVFMPVFVIALLGNFVFQPYLNQFGILWNANERIKLKRLIKKLVFCAIGISIAIVIVGSVLGIPVLQLVYGVDLTKYKTYLIIFMIDGSIIALQNLFIMIVTTVRYQKYMIYGYVVLALMLVSMGKTILLRLGLMGLCCFYTLILLLLVAYLMVLMTLGMRKENDKNRIEFVC